MIFTRPGDGEFVRFMHGAVPCCTVILGGYGHLLAVNTHTGARLLACPADDEPPDEPVYRQLHAVISEMERTDFLDEGRVSRESYTVPVPAREDGDSRDCPA